LQVEIKSKLGYLLDELGISLEETRQELLALQELKIPAKTRFKLGLVMSKPRMHSAIKKRLETSIHRTERQRTNLLAVLQSLEEGLLLLQWDLTEI